MKKIKVASIIFLILMILIQFIPIDLSNPSEHKEPNWDSEKTKEYFYRACADCHSNRVKFPFYSKIAPISWLIYFDVKKGREEFNISNGHLKEANHSSRLFKIGAMPLFPYLLLHSEARLSDTESNEFIIGLEKTFGIVDEKLYKEHYGE